MGEGSCKERALQCICKETWVQCNVLAVQSVRGEMGSQYNVLAAKIFATKKNARRGKVKGEKLNECN